MLGPESYRDKGRPKLIARRGISALMVLAAALLVIALVMPAGVTEARTKGPRRIQDALDSLAGPPPDPARGMGLKPAPPGEYPAVNLPPEGEPLGSSVDLSGELPPVGDQGAQGSCVGWATSYYYKSWVEKQEHTTWDLENPYYQFSPAFVYNQINGGVDGGAYFEDAFNLLENTGDVDIAEMPYSQHNYTRQPTSAQLEAAKPYRIPSDWASFWNQQYLGPYNPPNPIEDAKAWLDSGEILVMGIPVYRDFPDYGTNPSSLYYDYDGSSSLAGGHAVCICGYDDNINPGGADADHRGGFKMVNSWGSGWNSPHVGFVYLSYDFTKRYVWEAWTMGNLSPDTPVIDSLSSGSGNVGATISIYGDNFGTDRRECGVSFNGTGATEYSFINEDVSVEIPAGATSGPLVVYDWEGTASNSVEFTVGIPSGDPPTVTSIDPEQGTSGCRLDVTVLGEGFSIGCQVRFTRSGGGSIEASGEDRIDDGRVDCSIDLSGAALGCWNVVVTNPDSQSGTLADTFTVEGATDTYEPNDSLHEAFGPLSPETEYLSYVFSQNDEDYYLISVPANCSTLSANLESIPADCDYDFEIYDGNGQYIDGSYNWYNRDERITLQSPSPGAYYLCVYPWQGYSESDPYLIDFSVEVSAPAPTIYSIIPSSGSVGTGVTISGNNFGSSRGPSRVTFNGVAAEDYTLWSDTHIKVRVPAGAASGPVNVRTASGGTSNSIPFTVTGPSNTPPGEDVVVTPDVGTSITFEQVTSGGNTTVERRSEPDIDGYLVAPGACCDITTTAEFDGGVRVTFSYSGFGFASAEENEVLVLHQEGDRWVDRTVTRDVDNDTVTAEVSGFSEFVVALPAGAEPVWYLAEGSTDWGFHCYLSVTNPNREAVTVGVTYMTEEGPVEREDITLPPESQATIDPRTDIGDKDFSTRIECLEGMGIAVDRTMYWLGQSAPSSDGHCSVGVPAPARTWYLPEGSSNWGFECWLLLQNPNSTTATVTVTYMIEDGEPVEVVKRIPANSRRTYNMADDIGPGDASIMVEADVPVIPERAMYRNGRRQGHDSIGATAPANEYYLAEGSTAWGFSTYVLVQNPNDTEAEVALTYMTTDGPLEQPPFVMPPNSRRTVKVDDVLPEADFSTRVRADRPIVAERAMYWGEGSPLGEVGHDSIGVPSAHSNFYLPDGESQMGKETWTLVQNPNDVDVEVEISYLTATGEDNVVFYDVIPAGSRRTYNMSDELPHYRAAIRVRSKVWGKKIIVERAMYWNGRGAGTDTIGAFTG